MSINRSFFVQAAKISLFDGSVTASQVLGLKLFLDYWEKWHKNKDDRWLAYILGTVHHETGRTFRPVRETFASSDSEAIKRLNKAFGSGKLSWVKNPYWIIDSDGKSWLGRGYCQLTHKSNYKRASELVGHDLVANPSLAMDPDIAARIIFEGMIAGLFTGKNLSHYFAASKEDWRNARRIINGIERADLVGSYAKKYYSCISYTT